MKASDEGNYVMYVIAYKDRHTDELVGYFTFDYCKAFFNPGKVPDFTFTMDLKKAMKYKLYDAMEIKDYLLKEFFADQVNPEELAIKDVSLITA